LDWFRGTKLVPRPDDNKASSGADHTASPLRLCDVPLTNINKKQLTTAHLFKLENTLAQYLQPFKLENDTPVTGGNVHTNFGPFSIQDKLKDRMKQIDKPKDKQLIVAYYYGCKINSTKCAMDTQETRKKQYVMNTQTQQTDGIIDYQEFRIYTIATKW